MNSLGANLKVDGLAGKRTISEATRLTGQTGRAAVVASLQMALNREGATLTVDGMFGPKTKRAYFAQYPHEMLPESWHTMKTLQHPLKSASTIFDVPLDQLLKLLTLEARKRRTKKGIEYSATAISSTGKHKGLLQLSVDAWANATEYAARLGVSIPEYDTHWTEPKWSIFAGAAYYQWAYRTASNLFGPLPATFEVKYALYNQGPGFAKALKGKLIVAGSQSEAALQSHKIAAKQVHEIFS